MFIKCRIFDMEMSCEPIVRLKGFKKLVMGWRSQLIVFNFLNKERFTFHELLNVSMVNNALRPVVRNDDIDRFFQLLERNDKLFTCSWKNSRMKIQTYLKESFHLISTGMVNGFDLMVRVRMFFKMTQLKVMRLVNSRNPSNPKPSKLNDSCHSQIIDIRGNPTSMKSTPGSSKNEKKI